jgi:hypothetical protein
MPRSHRSFASLVLGFQRTRRLPVPGLTFQKYLDRTDYYDRAFDDCLSAWQRIDVYIADCPIHLN